MNSDSSRHPSRQTHAQRVRPETPFKRQSQSRDNAIKKLTSLGYTVTITPATTA